MADHQAAEHREPVAVLGTTSWDEFLVLDRLPTPGSGAIIRHRAEAGGGTAANVAVALARLGVRPLFVTTVGSDRYGAALLADLERENITLHILPRGAGTPTDRCTILVTPGPERTILWHPGAHLQLGDPLPLDRVFQARIVVIDVEDHALRQFLLDLPAHIAPRIQLVGPLTHLALLPRDRALRLAIQHDVLVGSEVEFSALTGCGDLDSVVETLRRWMPLGATRLAAITRGRGGCVLVSPREIVSCPAFAVEPVDPTGAGDAFTAGLIYGLLERLSLPELGRFANAVGALATRRLGARSALPTRDEVLEFIAQAQPCS
ncbi:carbohydrate kinase family protein [Thermomicrobium sp. 4228-Ro]|uniref:carbohydrate kinase family protein n=1 Tax=Thermomicrobium sp. 4228-Ro TaxID=2993937 RepID=UPI0022493602|nr:carbohydrate kinase family protein [Thermomicrobium sp. 4228-Ro]MCX2727667.1 carbohydrate kinase family protein [Thermomicrobium sp. 4228-Ro]